MQRKKIRNLFFIILAVVMCWGVIQGGAGRACAASAEVAEPTFLFALKVNGKDTVTVLPGDIITVSLYLKRTDQAEGYSMYAMQDEIRYDSQFFELVEGSVMTASGIHTTDIALRDQFRELYMNYLSVNGGEEWQAETLLGSFQLRIKAQSGTSYVTNQDYLVSRKDGKDSYAGTAEDVTVIVSAECEISYETNGGDRIVMTYAQRGDLLIPPQEPVREGYVFDGWYRDIDLTWEWDFAKDRVKENMTLYAKWKRAEKEDVPLSPPTGGHDSCLWFIPLAVILLLGLLLYLKKRKQQAQNGLCKNGQGE